MMRRVEITPERQTARAILAPGMPLIKLISRNNADIKSTLQNDAQRRSLIMPREREELVFQSRDIAAVTTSSRNIPLPRIRSINNPRGQEETKLRKNWFK
jgi:hypothetical protein